MATARTVKPPRSNEVFLKVARERWAQGQAASEKQRKRELADLAFYAGGDHQWDPEALRLRQAQQGESGMPPLPARPVVTVDKVREPIQQILNQERQNDMTIDLVGADDFEAVVGPLAETEIELREGLVRRIQRTSEAADARSWAYKRAVIAGVGYYGIKTRYVAGKTWDQEIYIERFYNQAAITIDPAHEQPDGSDAEWAFEGSDVPWDRYKAEFPTAADGEKNRIAAADDAEFRALGEDYPGWFTTDKSTKSARVVNYWYTEREHRTLVQLATGEAAWEDELPDGDATEILAKRDVIQKRIQWAKIDAVNILDETDWLGPDLPIVKVLGEEIPPFDDQRRAEGMIRPARDPAQAFNLFVSKWVEMVGLTPIAAWQVAEGQIDGYEAWYQAANTRALPYLPYRQKDLEGNPATRPERTNVDTPIAAVSASVQLFDEAIKSTTRVPNVQLGRTTDPELKSGRAIRYLQEQAQLGTSNYLDNLKRSMRYEGQILNNLLYPIYGRPGRIVRIMTGEGDTRTVTIAPSPNGGGPPPQGAKTYALTPHAQFNVVVKITRGYDTRRTEEATIVGQMLEQNPQLMAVFGDLFFKHQDGPGHDEMAERAKVMLDPKVQAMVQAQTEGQELPPEALAQITQLQARLQQAEQVLQQAKQELEGKDREQQMKLHIVELELASKEKLAALDRETKITVAELGARVERMQLFLEERARVGDQQHEMALAAAKAAHEMRKLRVTKTLQRGPDGQLVGATEDHEEVM